MNIYKGIVNCPTKFHISFRSWTSVQLTLSPFFLTICNIIIIISYFQCPMFKRDGEKETPEPFAEQAKFFTECRLLQKEVKVSLQGVSNQLVYGSIKHPVRVPLPQWQVAMVTT